MTPTFSSASGALFGELEKTAGTGDDPAALSSRAISADETARRALNILVALVGIVVTAPLMAVVAILVRLDSPGPAIYRQSRVGIDRRGRDRRRGDRGGDGKPPRRRRDTGGRVFTIYKFRTMRVEPDGTAERWATENDDRITGLGRFLRSTRIDELPQLFNVLLGDMNVVGPRPEQPTIFADLRREVDDYGERQKVLPGITGLAQIELGYDTTIDCVKKKVDLDLEYIGKRSAATDLAIMARTMPVMVFRKVWM